jgi:hypothetical protein
VKRLSEASIRGIFNFATFKRFEDQFDAYNYACETLKFLGKGSGRVAYAYSSGKVLKLAMNEKGFAQNEVEISVYAQRETRNIIAKIYEHDTDMMWVLAELVRPIRDRQEFLEHICSQIVPIRFFPVTGGEYEHMPHMLDVITDILRDRRTTIDTLGIDPAFAQSMRAVVLENNLDSSDIETPRAWGKTSDGRLVLLDYGFSHEVRTKHYSEFEE